MQDLTKIEIATVFQNGILVVLGEEELDLWRFEMLRASRSDKHLIVKLTGLSDHCRLVVNSNGLSLIGEYYFPTRKKTMPSLWMEN